MPVVRIHNYVDLYRAYAKSTNVHRLDGRGDDRVGTEYLNSRILESLQPTKDDVLLDIGCGDGCLLRLAEGRVGRSIGIVPTAEERSRLLASYPSLNVLIGTAQNLPLDSASASLVVCNSVLLLLSREEIEVALREIARVARPGAKIWLGEIPGADEYAYLKNYRGSSALGLLWHQFSNKSFRTFLSTARALLACAMSEQMMVLNSCGIFYATPEAFVDLAQKRGLKPISHFMHVRKDRCGRLIECPPRYNYVFTR